MSEQIDNLTTKKYYDHISVAKRTKQLAHFVLPHDKPAMLEQILKNITAKNTVIITKNKRSADELSTYLKSKYIIATAIHGNHRVVKQEETVTAFNAGEINVLITTDMILQTLELNTIDKIISYDLPIEAQNYFSRVRYVDEIGESIALISSEDEKLLKNKKKKSRHTKKRASKNIKTMPK